MFIFLIKYYLGFFLVSSDSRHHHLNGFLFKISIIHNLNHFTFPGTSSCLPLITETLITNRLASIVINFSGIYVMLSLSYEPLFLMFFCMSLVTWIHAEQHIYNDQKEVWQLFWLIRNETWILNFYFFQVSKLSFINNICSNKAVDFEDFRRSLIFVSIC